MLATKTRTCTGCGQTKPFTSEFFDADKTKKDGLHTRCKKCKSNRGKKRANKPDILIENVKVAPRPKPSKNQPKTDVAGEISDVNKRAILRLIKRHRSEFEFYVFEEERAARSAARKAKAGGKRWISLSNALDDPEDREVLPEFAAANNE